MRISDWSSDVCSSDLTWPNGSTHRTNDGRHLAIPGTLAAGTGLVVRTAVVAGAGRAPADGTGRRLARLHRQRPGAQTTHRRQRIVDDSCRLDRKSTRLNSSH